MRNNESIHRGLIDLLLTGGKSAIMTAIIVALGGKAHSTQRPQSLKEFIQLDKGKYARLHT